MGGQIFDFESHRTKVDQSEASDSGESGTVNLYDRRDATTDLEASRNSVMPYYLVARDALARAQERVLELQKQGKTLRSSFSYDTGLVKLIPAEEADFMRQQQR